MGATTTEGTGPGAVDNILKPIYNGMVKHDNIVVNSLVDYRIDIEATGNVTADGYMYASGSITAGTDLTVGGNVAVSGNITAGGYVRGAALGQTLNTAFWTSSGNIATTTSGYVQVSTGSYTPVSNNSFLNIEYHAAYTVNGAGTDSFRSRITIDGSEITYRTQSWVSSGNGQDVRGSVLLPIVGVTTNSITSGRTIAIEIARNGSDDTVTVDRSSSMLKLTEVHR
jgi:hypothetical protein